MLRTLMIACGSWLLATAAATADFEAPSRLPTAPVNLTAPPAGGYDSLFEVVATGKGFLAAWTRTAGATHTGLAQQFRSNGTALKDPITIDDPTLGNGIRPKLVPLDDKTVAVVWQHGADIHAGLINLAKNTISRVRRIDATDDLIHDAVLLSNGNIAIVTIQADISNPNDLREKVSLIILSPKLATVVAAKSVHGSGFVMDAGNSLDHTIVAKQGGGGLVIFRDRTTGHLLARGFTNGGALDAGTVRISSRQQTLPTLLDAPFFEVKATTLTDGTIAVVWVTKEATGADLYEVRGRVLSAAGQPLGSDFVVHGNKTGRQYSPEIVALPDARFLVNWVSDLGSTRDIKYRSFDNSGLSLFAPRSAHSEFVSIGFLPFNTEAAFLADGSVVNLMDTNVVIGPIRANGVKKVLPNP